MKKGLMGPKLDSENVFSEQTKLANMLHYFEICSSPGEALFPTSNIWIHSWTFQTAQIKDNSLKSIVEQTIKSSFNRALPFFFYVWPYLDPGL